MLKKILSCLLPLFAVGCASSAPSPSTQAPAAGQSQEPSCAMLYERLHRDAQTGPDMNFWGHPVLAIHQGSQAMSVASAIVGHRFQLRGALLPGAPDFPEELTMMGAPDHPNAPRGDALGLPVRPVLKGLPFLLYLEEAEHGPQVARYVPVMDEAEARALDALIRSGQCMPWGRP